MALAVFFGSCTVLLLVFYLRAVARLASSTKGMEARLAKLEKRLAGQSAELAKLKDSLQEQKADPLMSVVETAFGWRDRGAALTAGLVGAQLFRSYWKSRKGRALPAPKEN